MNNLIWSILLGIVLNPQPTLLDVTQVTHLMDVSCLIKMKIAVKDENGIVENRWAGCSGTFVGDNEVLTAAHCFSVPHVATWVRTPKGDSHIVDKIIKISPSNDLCLLHIVGPKHVSAKLALHSPQKGDAVYAVGSPYVLEFLLSEGIISAVNVAVRGFTAHYIVTTAMINPGSSGGGSFNQSGELVGVNTMTYGSPFGWAGISLAVDLSTIKGFLK